MRYVLLLLILCLAFFLLNSVSRYQVPLSFLSNAGNANVSMNAGHRPHAHWATASMAPTKGGPSAGIGLSKAISVASDAHYGAAMDNARAEVGVAAAAAPSPVTVAAVKENATIDLGTSLPANGEAVSDAPVAPMNDAVAASDVQTMDLESDIAESADYLDMDLAALPDVAKVAQETAFAGLTAEASAFAFHINDSIHNSLMEPHGIQFGGIAGLNWSGAAASAAQGKVTGTPLTGFTLGLFSDIPLSRQFSFRPAALYQFEGFQANLNGEKVNIHMASLNLPLDLVYHKSRFFVGAGPYASYAMGGTYTLKGINTDMQFGNNYASGDNSRRLDYGVNVMGGLLMDRNFVLGASFNYGLANMAPSGSSMKVATRSFGLSIGYVFRNRQNMPVK